MNGLRLTNLLWADDDSTLMLKPLRWGLERGGLRVIEARTYVEAQELLDGNNFDSLLVDTILPRTLSGGTLRSYLGLDLAEYAALRGVRCIVFLSVVTHSEVDERYNQIVAAYPRVRFRYEDKLMLLEPNTIEGLVELLKPPKDR